jgi:pyrroline-5-carboxylate reductase
MPNTPGSIGQGITGWAPEKELSAEEKNTIESVLAALGPSVQVSEN